MLRRAGHTEATIDMARLAGLYPAGALMEIMNEDGTMAQEECTRTRIGSSNSQVPLNKATCSKPFDFWRAAA